MKSQKLTLPKYDLPIRLRPVRPLTCFRRLAQPFAVVPALYNLVHAPPRLLRIHRLAPLSTPQQQVCPPHLLLHRHGHVLLHH